MLSADTYLSSDQLFYKFVRITVMVNCTRSTNLFVILFIILSTSVCISGFSSNMIAYGDKKGISYLLPFQKVYSQLYF